MYALKSPIPVFIASGFVSGLLSGLAAAVPPLGIVAPGFLFGIALCFAIQSSLSPVPLWQHFTLVGVSIAAFFAANVGALLTIHLPGVGDGFFGETIMGGFGGCIGAMIVTVPIVAFVKELETSLTLVFTTIAGAVFGALFVVTGVYISDYTTYGHPYDDIVSFPMWQAGVAATVPLFRNRNGAPHSR